MFALAAAPAQAAEYHSEAAETDWSGAQGTLNTFTTHSGTIHCSSATFTGTTLAATTSELILTPAYKECVSTGFVKANVTVDTNGCKFKLTPSGTVQITGCTESKGIVVTAPFCTITMTEQTVEKVDYGSSGSGTTRNLLITSTIGNLSYHEKGFACKNETAQNTTGGKYEGTISLTGETEEEFDHVGVWVE